MALAVALSACSSPPQQPASAATASRPPTAAAPAAVIDPQQALSEALKQLQRQHYLAAEGSLSQLSDRPGVSTTVRNTARAALTLLYLDKSNTRHSLDRATAQLDKLYFSREQESEQQALLFLALKIAVERSLEVAEQQQQLAGYELRLLDQQKQLQSLQQALDKLRRLSLQ